jgi:hypothetical protein
MRHAIIHNKIWFYDQPLQLHTNQEGHMRLLISRFIHLVIKDV